MIFVMLGVTFLSISSLSAQPPPSLAKGERVRLWGSMFGLKATVATVIAVESDSLRFSIPSRSNRFKRLTELSLSVPWATLSKVEVRREGGSKALVGAGIGFATGALVGGVIGFATYSESSSDDGVTRPLLAAVGAGFGAATGMLVGLVIGAGSSGERWQSVPLNFHAGVSPNGTARFQLAAHINF
jgi:hypothetical protein